MPLEFIKPELLSLKTHPELSEKWVQDRIAADPSILGLGDVELIAKKRRSSQKLDGSIYFCMMSSSTVATKLN